MLRVLVNTEVKSALPDKSFDKGIKRTVTLCCKAELSLFVLNDTTYGGILFIRTTRLLIIPTDMALFEGNRLAQLHILRMKQFMNLLNGQLNTGCVSNTLNRFGKIRLHPFRNLDTVILFKHIGHSTLSGLTVDTHDSLIVATNILRVNWQIGNGPQATGREWLRFHSLADCILVRA